MIAGNLSETQFSSCEERGASGEVGVEICGAEEAANKQASSRPHQERGALLKTYLKRIVYVSL